MIKLKHCLRSCMHIQCVRACTYPCTVHVCTIDYTHGKVSMIHRDNIKQCSIDASCLHHCLEYTVHTVRITIKQYFSRTHYCTYICGHQSLWCDVKKDEI